MIPLLAAIVLAGAAGAGPVLVSDACGNDSTEVENNRCAIEAVDKAMKARPRPKELKVRLLVCSFDVWRRPLSASFDFLTVHALH